MTCLLVRFPFFVGFHRFDYYLDAIASCVQMFSTRYTLPLSLSNPSRNDDSCWIFKSILTYYENEKENKNAKNGETASNIKYAQHPSHYRTNWKRFCWCYLWLLLLVLVVLLLLQQKQKHTIHTQLVQVSACMCVWACPTCIAFSIRHRIFIAWTYVHQYKSINFLIHSCLVAFELKSNSLVAFFPISPF